MKHNRPISKWLALLLDVSDIETCGGWLPFPDESVALFFSRTNCLSLVWCRRVYASWLLLVPEETFTLDKLSLLWLTRFLMLANFAVRILRSSGITAFTMLVLEQGLWGLTSHYELVLMRQFSTIHWKHKVVKKVCQKPQPWFDDL